MKLILSIRWLPIETNHQVLWQIDWRKQQFYQAGGFLREGGQNYDVMDWILKIYCKILLTNHERHLHFKFIFRNISD